MNCERKFGWQYICGYEDPGNEDTEFGKEVHAELEKCKKEPGHQPNRLTEVGAVASEGLPFVEDFSLANGATCEGEFFLTGRHPWKGFIDLRKPGVVNDYKTTGDFKHAKTPEALLNDVQAVLYATYELAKTPGLDGVDLQWLYLRKRAPYAAKPVRVRMPRAHAERMFAGMERVADELQRLADGAPDDPALRHRYVLDVLQPNPKHCGAYRGCPHQDRCNLPFFQEKGKETVDLLAKLQAMDALNGGPANAPPPAPAPTPPSPPVASGAFAPGGAFAGTDAAALVAQTASEGATDAPAPAVAAEPNAVNPPKRGRPKGSKNKPKDDATAAPALPAAGSSLVTAVVGAPGAVTVTPEQAASMLGIPVADVKAVSPGPAPIEIKITGPAPAPVPGANAEPHRITTLYIGCVPHGAGGETDVVDFDLLVAKCKVAIGPATYFQNFGYKANGMLLQMMEGVLQHEKPEALVVTYPNAPEATLCLSLLRSISDTVVEAVR